jgi:flagellar biosynthetic protein FliR
MTELAHVLPLLPGLLLHFVRAGAFFVAMPLFGMQEDSRMLRLVLAVSLASVFWWTGERAIAVPDSLLGFGLIAVREACVGLAAGFAVGLLTAALVTAGEVISHEMGFGMAQIVNPATGQSSPVTSQLFEAMGYLLLFQLDAHHEVLRVLAVAYETLPVGQEFDVAPIAARLQAMIGDSMEAALHYAAPVLGVMVLVTATLVVLARAVPTINLLEFTFGVRIMLALLASAYFLTEGVPFLARMFANLLGQARMLFVGT